MRIDLGPYGELKRLNERVTGGQLAPLTRAIRWQNTAIAVLAVLVFLLIGAVLNMTVGPPSGVVPAMPTGAPTVVELSVFGPGPAAEVIGHIAYVDGTENELPPGTYRLAGLAGAQMQIMSDDPDNPAGCRIVVDGVIRAEAVAEQDGYHAVCRWEAPKWSM